MGLPKPCKTCGHLQGYHHATTRNGEYVILGCLMWDKNLDECSCEEYIAIN